jgi:hypothetical protein
MNRKQKNFHRFWGAFLGLLLVMAGPVLASAQPAKVPQDAMTLAPTFLRQYLKNVVNRENFSTFGFVSYKETRWARVGKPYPVMLVPLDGLKAYQQGTSLKSLWLTTGKWWFPVLVDGQGRTKMEVVEKNGQYLAGEFGGTKTAREVLNVRSKLPQILAANQIIPTEVKLVMIPALMANFLFLESSQEEFLIPCMVHPQRYNLKNGILENPDTMLTILQSYAKEIDENLFR